MHNLTQGITLFLLGSFEITGRGIKQKEERHGVGKDVSGRSLEWGRRSEAP